MNYRRIKGIDKDISLLGFGCMRLPKLFENKEDIDFDEAQRLIDFAYENGVNYFDTAYGYHNGMSEDFIGRALQKYPRESFFLATKMPGWVGSVRQPGGAKKLFEGQLKKCRVDYFDFYMFHSVNFEESYNTVYEEAGVADYLFEERKNGRIKKLGFSFHGSVELMKKLLPLHDWDFVQIQLNYLDWDNDAKVLYELIEERGIPCIVMEPVRGGRLVNLCEESVKILKEAAPDKSTASWAIRFAASLPNVLTVLSGMSTFEQVEDNIKTLSVFSPMTAGEYSVLGRALGAYLKTSPIPCTACRYCMDCDSGVDIPGVFDVYNNCAESGNLPMGVENHDENFKKKSDFFLNAFSQINEPSGADKCTGCMECVEKCPQKINIPNEMQRISKLIDLQKY